MKAYLLAALIASPTPALADVYRVDVAYYGGDATSVSVPGYGSPWTTPITLTNGNGTLIAFCADLDHEVTVGGWYDYQPAKIATDGLGRPLTIDQSNAMGQIANLGREAYAVGNEAKAVAAQAAIWSVEYGVTTSSSSPAVEAYLSEFMTVRGDPTGPWAYGYVSPIGAQTQIGGVVPEASTWVMCMAGFLALAFMVRRRSPRSIVESAI